MTPIFMAALCMVGCTYEGYDSGKYENKKCACVNYYDADLFLLKKKKVSKHTAESEESNLLEKP